jgi:hypothetical protein
MPWINGVYSNPACLFAYCPHPSECNPACYNQAAKPVGPTVPPPPVDYCGWHHDDFLKQKEGTDHAEENTLP